MPTRTELIWDGKYDATGRRVAPFRGALPFQTVETVNESAQDRARSLFQHAEQDKPWRNRLIWGDKRYVLPSLLEEFAGTVNLIYIDPPFDTGADFSFTAEVPPADDEDDSELEFIKEPSVIEQKAYRDTWGRGIESYLQWFYETAVVLHELLAETGSMYVHLDWHVVHYCKAILDEVFGLANFRNEIVWKRSDAKGDATQGSEHYGRVQDTILFYSKSEKVIWHPQYVPLSKQYEDNFYKYKDENGRRYKLENMLGPGGAAKGNPVYEVMGVKRAWRYSKKRMQGLIDQGLVIQTSPGAVPMQKKYLEDSKGVQIGTWWDDISMIRGWSHEKTGYKTQKPEALLERIIKSSSNEGELVLDCFAGSGTTAAVAEKLNRRWLACDLGRFAIHTTRKRLLRVEGVRPFVVQNLGKYERQLWQSGQFAKDGPETEEQAAVRNRAYVAFILKLYDARPITGRNWLHGARAGRMVHVGSVEAPVTVGDVKNMIVEFRKVMGSGKDAPNSNAIDVLGWDFAFEINETARQQAADANIKLIFKRIPRDVMDKRAVDQGEIKFFELAALSVDAKAKAREVTLTLADFVIPPDDVPEDVREAVKHWSQWIDYWAIDWDYDGHTFHNQWQTFRSRAGGKLALETKHTYEEPGEHKIVAKVIDILGNDTTKTVKVKLR